MSNIRNNQKRKALVLAVLATAQLIISIDYNIVYVALPEIGRSVGFSAHTLQWVVSAYAVAFGGFLLLGGRACDVLGAKRMFVVGLSLYAGSSLVGGLASDPGVLIAARAVQGIGGAVLFPATLTLVSLSFAAGPERNRAFAVWGTAGGSGMILGSLLGGTLTQAFGWPAVFFVNVPLALAVALIGGRVITAGDTGTARSGRQFDLSGSVMATLGITAVVYAVVDGPEVGWTAPSVQLTAILGVGLLAAFFVQQRRSSDPLLPLHLIRNRNLAVGSGVTFGYMASFGTLLYFLTLYFQLVRGHSALETGIAFLVPMVAIAVGAQTAGAAATRFGAKATLLASLVIGGSGAVLVVTSLSASGSYLDLVPGLLVLGVGQGAGYTIMFGAATEGVDPAEQGVGSGIVSTTQQIGGAVGLAVLVAVASTEPGASPTEITEGIRSAIWVAIAFIAATGVLALGLRSSRPGATSSEPVPAESAYDAAAPR
jgi:EmrB/QacA subfamily drug resistance transporter